MSTRAIIAGCVVLSVSCAAPGAHADEKRVDTRDPAYRVMTVFSLGNMLASCPNVNYDHAMAVTINIVAEALKENPNMDTSYMYRKAQSGPYMGPYSKADCKDFYQRIIDISNGVVFE